MIYYRYLKKYIYMRIYILELFLQCVLAREHPRVLVLYAAFDMSRYTCTDACYFNCLTQILRLKHA